MGWRGEEEEKEREGREREGENIEFHHLLLSII